MTNEKWISPKQIAEKYNVSYETARTWIKKIMGDAIPTPEKRRERQKRPHRIRRIPESLLEKHLPELLNG